MRADYITKPCGLISLRKEVESICDKNYIYQRCRMRPDHLIVPLDPKSGRTTFLEYLTDMFKAYNVLSFTSGPDDYVEVAFDGSFPQLLQAFSEIDSAAIFKNDYTGIVGMDISELAAHLCETQVSEFLKRTKKVCDSAYVIFFVHHCPSKNEERLLAKLTTEIGNVKRIDVEAYTIKDFADIIVKNLKDHGIKIKGEKAVTRNLVGYLKLNGCATVDEALDLSQALMFRADYSGFVPELNPVRIKRYIRENEVRINE